MDKDQAIELIADANRVPQPGDFGYFACDDHPFGAGSFRWSASLEALLRVLVEADPLLYADDALGPALRDLLAEEETPELSEELRASINKAAKGSFCVEWWGTFEALCSGEGEFSRRLVGRFQDDLQAELEDEWEEDAGPVPEIDREAPVPMEHRRAFADSLLDYGA